MYALFHNILVEAMCTRMHVSIRRRLCSHEKNMYKLSGEVKSQQTLLY